MQHLTCISRVGLFRAVLETNLPRSMSSQRGPPPALEERGVVPPVGQSAEQEPRLETTKTGDVTNKQSTKCLIKKCESVNSINRNEIYSQN